MATIALSAIAGSLGANAFWLGVAGFVGGMLDQRFFGAKINTHQEIGKQSDLKMQTASMGAPIITGYGRARVAGNIIWGTKFTEHVHTSSQSVGGKGGGGDGGTITTTTYSYTVSFATAICAGPIKDVLRVWADGAEIKIRGSDVPIDYTLYRGDEVQQPDPFMVGIEGAGNVPAYRGLAYIVVKNLDVGKFGNRIPSLTFEVEFPENKVTQIIQNVSMAAGLDAAKVKLEGLADMQVEGFTIAGDKTFRSQIEALQTAFPFDGFEYDGTVIFRKRGTGDVVTIDADDLGAQEGESEDAPLTVVRAPEIDLPKTVKLAYISKDRSYQDGAASYTKTVAHGVNEVSLDTSLVLKDSDAVTVTEQRMKEYWASRTSFSFKLSTRYATVQAGTLIDLPYNGRSVKAMVSNVSYGLPGLNEITAHLIHGQTFAAMKRDIDTEGKVIEPPKPTEVRLEVIDTAVIPTVEGDGVVLLSVAAKIFYGANLYRSIDGGVSFSLIKSDMRGGVIGDTVSALGVGTSYTWDNRSSVDVRLVSGTLESRQEIDVLNGANLCIIGEELIQYRSAVLIAEDTYRLSGLLRGRFGTEHYIKGHVAGERFVRIHADYVEKLTTPTADWFKSYVYRYGSASYGVTHESYRQNALSIRAHSSMPLAPCHLEGRRDKDGNLHVSWVRRTRGDGDMKDYIDVPLNETAERYECCVVKDGNEIRTFAVHVPRAVYTAAAQTADFGGIQGNVRVRVYQISETRGRGFVREEII
nr:MAG TPA: tail protein [Caudoviricetes sp.]